MKWKIGEVPPKTKIIPIQISRISWWPPPDDIKCNEVLWRYVKIIVSRALRNIHSLCLQNRIYVGESKIIRTYGTCFAVGYAAGSSWQNTHGLLLSYHCGASVTLIVHFCLEFFCHKHGNSQFLLHQRRAEGSDPFLWTEGVSRVQMHRMMSVQYGNSVMSQRIVC